MALSIDVLKLDEALSPDGLDRIQKWYEEEVKEPEFAARHDVYVVRALRELRRRREAEQAVEVSEAEQNKRLADYVAVLQSLKEVPAKQLVNLALEHVSLDLPPLQNLLLEELCTRVYPNWLNEEPSGVAP